MIGLPYTTPRRLASVAGKIVSASYVLGNISSLMTRLLHYLIATDIFDGNWDGRLNLVHENYALSELFLWERNLKKLNSRSWLLCEAHSFTGHSDASDFALGAILKDLKDQRKRHVCRQSFSEDEVSAGSTSRELKAILLALRSFRTTLSGHKVKWYSDNQGPCHIFKKGSIKLDLQDVYVIVSLLILNGFQES